MASGRGNGADGERPARLREPLWDARRVRACGRVHARDKEYERQRTLQQQLQLLRSGTLLVAPNQVYSRVEDLDARLKASSERIETLRAQLAAHRQQAEVLLGEAVTSQQARGLFLPPSACGGNVCGCLLVASSGGS